jgi:lipopolysaccharide/colanic/teichoic acid biosynthesis glycosyltransferase
MIDSQVMRLRVKRAGDCFVAATALLGVSPIFAGIAARIRFAEGRPVIFTQARTGQNGRPFMMFKFRTMVRDAVTVGQLSGLTGEDPFGIVEHDPRITRSGRYLRRTSLDELPQLVNVLRGDMSLVGPRPDVPEQSRHYTAEDRRRLLVRPGITGWAQVNGRDDLPWPERYVLDAWYIDHWSLRLDLKILLLTALRLGREEPVPQPDVHNMRRRADGSAPSNTAEG